MDWQNNDIIYTYKGFYDAEGAFIPTWEIIAKITGLEAAGKPAIKILSGAEYFNFDTLKGSRWVKVGNTANILRQSGLYIDTVSAASPRLVCYSGLNDHTKLFDSSITLTQIGKLGDIYNANLGGYLTNDGLITGAPLVGLFTKSLFADISGGSRFVIKQDNDNHISFISSVLSLAATTFNLKSTNLGIYSGANAMILLGHATDYASAKIGLKNDGSGKLASNNIYWDASGNVSLGSNLTVAGNLIMGAAGSIQINGAGVGANGYVIDVNGIRGYSSTLGLVFDLPTNGSAPTFSSGKIKEVEFEIYTSGVIRTSATVGNGSASSAGVLVNNTGIYGLGANQAPSTANVKILVSTGEFFAKLGTVGGWTIGSTSLTSTSIGFHSGANAMILLGHATDYASAKIGLKNDGSGKLASGNLSWDISGNVTQSGTWTSTATITGATIQNSENASTRVLINSYGLSIGAIQISAVYANYTYSTLIDVGSTTSISENNYKIIAGIGGTELFRIRIGSNDAIYMPHFAQGVSFSNGLYVGVNQISTSNPPVISATGKFTGSEIDLSEFIINTSGQITKVNNLAASSYNGYGLISDGTSFTVQKTSRWRGVLSSAPSSPLEGDFYYDTSLNKLRFYKNSSDGWGSIDVTF